MVVSVRVAGLRVEQEGVSVLLAFPKGNIKRESKKEKGVATAQNRDFQMGNMHMCTQTRTHTLTRAHTRTHTSTHTLAHYPAQEGPRGQR